MRDSPGQALAEALMRHRILQTYKPEHDGKQVVAGWVRRPPSGYTYLLLQRAEEHFYVKRQALGADTAIFTHASTNFEIDDVVIIYTGRRGRITVYRATWATWEERAFRVSYPGFDEQLQLPVRTMQVWEADR